MKYSELKTPELKNKTIKCTYCDEFITVGDMRYEGIGNGQLWLRCPVCGGLHTEEEVEAMKETTLTDLWNGKD